jgi:mersacidin/lichenicidin family type 2 lantibiotic
VIDSIANSLSKANQETTLKEYISLKTINNMEKFMLPENIIRAWKDENFRNSLSKEERTLLPRNPIGIVAQTDAELKFAVGAAACTGACNLCHA